MFMRIAATALCCTLAIACGGEEDSPNRNNDNNTPVDDEIGHSFSATISASTGGEVATASGRAKLVIPAGALSTDKLITIDVLGTSGEPDVATLVSSVYDFGPDGTTFAVPATLSIALGKSIPNDKRPVLSWLDGTTWTDLPSTVVSGRVVAEVTHFTKFVLRFIDFMAVFEPSDAVCSSNSPSACGGDVVGTWSMEAMCVSFDMGNPFGDYPHCDDAVSEIDIDTSGTVEFKNDGTYVSTFAQTMQQRLEIDDDCIGDIVDAQMQGATMEPADFCALLSTDMDDAEGYCSYANGKCTCIVRRAEPESEDSGTWATSGNQISLDGETASDYCVANDTLVVEMNDPEVSGFIVLSR